MTERHRRNRLQRSRPVCTGWRICEGRQEVALKSHWMFGGPSGSLSQVLFFAVRQHSTDGSVCDETQETNDVFDGKPGAGWVRQRMRPAGSCLASTNSCGFNEAEPSLGPWEFLGGPTSHLQEGSVVTKSGCPQNSCSTDGVALGSSSKGGVLCCRHTDTE